MIDVDEIKDSHNIVDVIGAVVDIKKKGADHFGCCPFHNEKTPSFTVSERKQFFHCFGCGVNGSVIDFVMEYQGVDFVAACEILGHDAALKPSKSLQNLKAAQFRAVKLPMDKEPVKPDLLKQFFAKCERFESSSSDDAIYFFNGCQAIMLTDTRRNPISAALVRSDIEPRFYGKEFLYGSCVVLGKIDGEVFLCEDWYTASKLHKLHGKNCICFFMPENINFIYSEIKHKNISMVAVCDSEEGIFQADKLNLKTGELDNV